MNVIIIIVTVIVIVVIITYLSVKLKNNFGKAELIDIFSYKDKLISVGKVFHSADDGGFYHTRISLIDKKTGKILHKISVSGEPAVFGIENQHIWLADKRILAIDILENKVVFTTEKIYKQYPEFEDIEFTNPYLNRNSSKIIFKTDTGYKYYIDCKTLLVNKYEENTEANKNIEVIEENTAEFDDKILKSKHFNFKKPKNSDRFKLEYKKEEIENRISFINPQILKESASKTAIPEENYIIFIHFQKLHSSSDFILTKINSTGKIEWNIEQKELKIKKKEYGITEIKKAIQFDDNLILPISTGDDKLVSLNISNGNVNWLKSVF